MCSSLSNGNISIYMNFYFYIVSELPSDIQMFLNADSY